MSVPVHPAPSARGLLVEFWRYALRRHGRTALLAVAGTLALTLLSNAGDREPGSAITTVAFYIPIAAGVLMMSGIVSDERRSGMIMLWFQKGDAVWRSYMIRYVSYQLMIAILVAALGVALGIVGIAWAGMTPVRTLRIAAAMIAVSALCGAIVFTFSAWGARRDGALAFLFVLISLMLGSTFVHEEALLGRFVMAVVFPFDAIQSLSGSGPRPEGLRAIGLILVQLVGWTLLGLIGLRHTERSLRRGR